MKALTLFVVLFGVQGALIHVAAQTVARIPTELQGNWTAKPLATKGMSVPGSPGGFLEFGEAYATESFVAFWARTSPKPGEGWVLFSWKDGRLTRVLEHGTVVMPDSRKVSISRSDTPIHAGKRLLYFSPTMPDHVYAWDGEKLVKVLANGDDFAFRDGRYAIKRARVLDVAPDGTALIYWDSAKQHANGWALHDGSSFTPLWMEGDELPGMAGVHIDNLSAGKYCYMGCVPSPRLLGDGSLLATVKVSSGGVKRLVLYRIWTGKVEEVAADSGTSAPRRGEPLPGAIQLGEILGATQHTFVMDASKSWLRWDSTAVYQYKRAQFLFSDTKGRRLSPAPGSFEFDQLRGRQKFLTYGRALYLQPDSEHALLTVQTGSQAEFSFKGFSYPGLYFWNSEGLSRVAWEEAIGLTPAAALEQLRGGVWGGAAVILIRPIPGSMGGVSVRLPLPAEGSRTWFVPADSKDGKLQPPPPLQVSGRTITLADVIAWRGREEVLAGSDEGFFLLSRSR